MKQQMRDVSVVADWLGFGWLVLAAVFAGWQFGFSATTELWPRVIVTTVFAVVGLIVMLAISMFVDDSVWNELLKFAWRPSQRKSILATALSLFLLGAAGYLAFRGVAILPWVIFAILALIIAPIGRVLNERYE